MKPSHYQKIANKRNQESWKSVFVITKRKCLNCSIIFNSEGNWNRVCCYCKKTLGVFKSPVMSY